MPQDHSDRPTRRVTPLSVIYPIGGAIMLGCMLALIYLAVFQDVSPFVSQRTVKVDANARGSENYLITTREFCFTKDNEPEAGRVFRRQPDSPGMPEEVVETIPTRLQMLAGCHIRSRRIDIPEGIRAGRWTYQTYLRWCNQFNNCAKVWLPAITIRVEGTEGNFRMTVESTEG